MEVDIPVYDRKDLLHESDIPSLEDLVDNYDDFNDLDEYNNYEDR
jgi:hypothetical protein